MPHITNQEKLLLENDLVLVSKGPLKEGWVGQYIKCPICLYYVSKSNGFDECICGNIKIDSDMLRISITTSKESEVETFILRKKRL